MSAQTGYDEKAAVEHVVHDYVYLVVAGTDTQKDLPSPSNHLAERTFLVHCRALAKFFSSEQDRLDRDIYARHFTKSRFVRESSTWKTWADHIDKHLMHLTKARVINRREWTGKPNKQMLEEFQDVWREFLADLQDDLKPTFQQELDGHRGALKDYPI